MVFGVAPLQRWVQAIWSVENIIFSETWCILRVLYTVGSFFLQHQIGSMLTILVERNETFTQCIEISISPCRSVVSYALKNVQGPLFPPYQNNATNWNQTLKSINNDSGWTVAMLVDGLEPTTVKSVSETQSRQLNNPKNFSFLWFINENSGQRNAINIVKLSQMFVSIVIRKKG